MRLRNVTIKNFRALANVTVELDDTTVLIGENNTGKTSFLEALKLCLSQGASRRGDLFDDYDHHLASDQSQIGDAGDTEIILRFAESAVGEWPSEVMQAITEAITLEGELQQVVLRVKSSKDAQTGEMAAKWEFLDAGGNPLKPRRPAGVVLRDLQQLKPFFYLSAVRDAAREGHLIATRAEGEDDIRCGGCERGRLDKKHITGRVDRDVNCRDVEVRPRHGAAHG